MNDFAASETLTELFRQREMHTPQHPVLAQRLPDGRWIRKKWHDFAEEVRRAATVFQQLGLQPGDRLAIAAPTGAAWQTAEWAGLLCGLTVIGLDEHAPEKEFAALLEDCQPDCLLATGSRRPSGAFLPEFPSKPLLMLDDEAASSRSPESWHDIVMNAEPAEDASLPAISSETVATWIYTSGTTGQPKAIPFNHAQWMAACRVLRDAFQSIESGEAILAWLPMHHLFQRMINLVALTQGCVTYFAPDPKQILKYIQEVRPPFFVGVPRFYEKLHAGIWGHIDQAPPFQRRLLEKSLAVSREYHRREADEDPIPLGLRLHHALVDWFVLSRLRRLLGGRIRYMMTGSAATPTKVLEFFDSLGLPLLEAYGVSECSVPVAANLPGQRRPGSVGKPLPTNEVKLADDGEVLLRGEGLFRGYVGRSPKDAFTSEGFYRTGDCGHFDADGYLHLTGRKSEFIKTSTGRRVSPLQVEQVYLRSSWIDELVVFGEGKPFLVALAVLSEEGHEAIRQSPHTPEETLMAALEPHSRELPAYAAVRRLAILLEPFSLERGEMTTTLKLRRPIIHGRHAALIESLYQTPVHEAEDVSASEALLP